MNTHLFTDEDWRCYPCLPAVSSRRGQVRKVAFGGLLNTILFPLVTSKVVDVISHVQSFLLPVPNILVHHPLSP